MLSFRYSNSVKLFLGFHKVFFESRKIVLIWRFTKLQIKIDINGEARKIMLIWRFTKLEIKI